MAKNVCEKYEIGDIVFVSKATKTSNNNNIDNHLYVIINNTQATKIVSAEYFGLIVSSQIQKSKENSHFIYNEPLNASSDNGLDYNSIVKCDEIYSIPPENINFKIGSVDIDDFNRFINSMESALEETE